MIPKVATANVTAGDQRYRQNPDVEITAVQYPGTTEDYQGSGGSPIQIWQIDFNNLGLFKEGRYMFAADGVGEGIPYWFNHASNKDRSGTPQDQSDDRYRWFGGNAGLASIAFGGSIDSDGFGWDKSSDINIQVFGEYDSTVIPEPASMALMGLGLLGLAAIWRRRTMG